MPIEISFQIEGDAAAALDRLVAAAADLTPAMGDIAGHLADETRERFETGIGPDGVPWKPSQRVLEHGGKTLVDRGDLLASIKEDWGADYAAAGPEASGGAAVYARIHQEGGTIEPRHGKALSFGGRLVARVTIPARPYLGFTDADADYVVQAIGDHLVRGLSGGGGVAA